MSTLPTVERRTIELASLAVPFVEVTGSADGPTLTVIAGVHGCEYASMDGVRRWLRTLEGRELRGRVRAVPVLNVTAFASRTPFVVPEDGKNLNRSFPGSPDGTLAERLAHDAFTQLITGSDAYVDAHCGDMVEALQPFALYEEGTAEDLARDMAAAYGLPYVIRQAAGPDRAANGTSSSAAAAAGIPAITAEAGGCGLVEEHAVAMHVAGLDGVLGRLGMTKAEAGNPAGSPTYLGRFIWPRCAEGGWWAPTVKAGDKVTQGQVIGTVSSLDGAVVKETVTAPADGVLIFVTSSPAVADDGLLLGLGAA
ncbi:MAG TPA: succinylglutamate desuccinylase/aspartoacylase family protein [Trebonia sp.]